MATACEDFKREAPPALFFKFKPKSSYVSKEYNFNKI
jgi:hypothetical protein